MKLGPVARSVALTSSRRALAPGLPASQGQRRARNAFSTRHALRKPADGAENVTTDDKQRHPFPSKLPPTRESKGPEYIKGDEGSHGQRTLKSFCMVRFNRGEALCWQLFRPLSSLADRSDQSLRTERPAKRAL